MDQHIITFLPEGHTILVPAGSTVMEAVTAAGLDFDFPCGGKGTCGKCRVRLPGAGPGDYMEAAEGLDSKEIGRGIRLACRTVVSEPLEVELPAGGGIAHAILHSGECDEESALAGPDGKSGPGTLNGSDNPAGTAYPNRAAGKTDIDPHVVKKYVELPTPSLEDQRADFERLTGALTVDADALSESAPAVTGSPGNGFTAPLPVFRNLPAVVRDDGFRITAVVGNGRILGIEPGDTTAVMLGAAFDIGTTTVVCYLLDLRTGTQRAVSSALNPQVKFGADVISRTNYCDENDGGLDLMRGVLIDAMNGLIDDCAVKAGAAVGDIYAVSVVGNTCMHHLFLGLSPRNIARVPFVPVVSAPLELSAVELGLRVNPAGRVFALPTVAGFVGADTVGVVLATGMDRCGDIELAIDIGTNGEMVLGSGDRLVACSTAAGPAFEGAHISSGMRGAEGAIDHVRFDGGAFMYSVIGGGRPAGLCGSGLLDIMAGLVRLGIINERGKLLKREEVEAGPPSPASPSAGRVRPTEYGPAASRPACPAASRPACPAAAYSDRLVLRDGAAAFLIEEEARTVHGRPIFLTQQDVRAVQLAKGAMAAGITVLMEEFGIGLSEIRRVLLAGAFGNYMDPASACAIGLVPPELEGRVRMVGNAAGTGARAALLSRGEYRRAAGIARKIEYVELGSHKDFTRKFADGMRF